MLRIGYKNEKSLYKGLIVPTVLYVSLIWDTGRAEHFPTFPRVNVIRMECLRHLAGVTRKDRVGNEEVRK